MKKRIKKWWQELTIQKKIAVFTGMVCVTILLSVVFNVWVVRFSLTDFNGILQDNAKCSELIHCRLLHEALGVSLRLGRLRNYADMDCRHAE